MRPRLVLLTASTLLIAVRPAVFAQPAQEAKTESPPAAQSETPAKDETDARTGRLAERDRLEKQGLELRNQGKHKEAIEKFRQVLSLETDLFSATHDELARTWDVIAQTHKLARDWPAAIDARSKIVAIRAKLHGENHYRVIDARLALDDARLRATLAPEQLDRLADADRQYAAAVQLYRQHKYADAIKPAAAARDVRRSVLGETHPDYATCLNYLGVLYDTLGDYATAEQLYSESMEIRKKVLTETHPDYATSLNNLGVLYKSTGEYAKAEPLYRQSMEIRKKLRPDTLPDYVKSLNNLALLYHAMGDYAKAEPLFHESIEILKRSRGGEKEYATSLLNQGLLYKSMGNYAKAESQYLQSMKIREEVLPETHPDYATSLNNLAVVYRLTGDYSKAEPLLHRSMAIRRKALGETHPDYATSLNNLAALYRATRDYTKAESLFRQSMEIRQKALPEAHPDHATSLYNLAALYSAMGDYAKAEPLFQAALSIRHRGMEASAAVLSDRQQRLVQHAFSYALEGYISAATEAHRLDRRAYEEVLRWKGNTTLRQRLLRAATTPATQRLLDDLMRSTTVLTAHLQSVPGPKQRDIWQRRLAELSESKEQIERQLSAQSAAFRQARTQVTFDQVVASLPANSALVDFLEYNHSAPSKGAKGGLESARRLLAVVVRPDASVSNVEFESPLTISELTELVAAWRTRFGQAPSSPAPSSSRAAETDDPATRLRARLWDPIDKKLDGVKTVLVSPDGVLCRLPIAALPGRKTGSYLIEDYAIAVAPVPQMLPMLAGMHAEAKTKQGALLLVGDVDYDAEASSDARPKRAFVVGSLGSPPSPPRPTRLPPIVHPEYPDKYGPLDATRGEIATIAKTIGDVFEGGGVRTLEKAGASETAFRELAPKHYFVHIATHGFFAPERFKSIYATSVNREKNTLASEDEPTFDINAFHPGLLSGLALAGANRPVEEGNDDGMLTAEEVATMNLDGVQLVTLSACETGLGAVAGGEGVLGLQRAFQISGARTVISSMWRVPDNETRTLMERFYRNLWEEEMTKLDALRQAQLWMLGGTDRARQPIRKRVAKADPDSAATPKEQETAKRLPPYYWAGFVLSGNWR